MVDLRNNVVTVDDGDVAGVGASEAGDQDNTASRLGSWVLRVGRGPCWPVAQIAERAAEMSRVGASRRVVTFSPAEGQAQVVGKYLLELCLRVPHQWDRSR